MALTIDDLRPKPFKVSVKGVELSCKPLRLSHALSIAQIGQVFTDPTKASKQQIKQAEADMDEVITELIPELRGVELDMSATMELIAQMMEQIEPSDNKELKERGVKLNGDPKADTTGS